MNGRTRWSIGLGIAGLVAMLAGTLDPLEGSIVILPGSGLIALGAYLGESRYRMLLLWAFVLIAAGVGAMVVFTAMGGIGGNSGHSLWWGLFILPYTVGWIISLVGAILRLIKSFKRPLRRRKEWQC